MRPCRPLTSRTRLALAVFGLVVALCAPSLGHSAEKLDPFQRDRTPLPASISGVDGETPAPGVEDQEDEEGEPAPGGGTSAGTLVRMVAGLAIVLVVIYGVYWLLRAHGRSKGAKNDERIGVLATTTLAPNRTVHLVRVGDELHLIGAAENGVSSLRSYRGDEATELEQQLGLGSDEAFTPLDSTPGTPLVERFAGELRRRTIRE